MSNITINLSKKVFNDKIYNVLNNYSYFTEVHYGGASSGKSHGVVQKVLVKALKNWKIPRKVLFMRKVAATIKDSIFEDVKSCLIDMKVFDFCKVNMSDYRIELPNGSILLFKGMDNPEKIKSIKSISDVVMEEATEFTLEDYTQLTIRLREKSHKRKQLFLMFNPVSKLNWVYKYFFEHGEEMKDVLIIHSTYTDNKFLDETVYRTLEDLANRNPAYYRIYALGDFATLDKLVFPVYESRLIDRKEVKHLPSYFGLDFGYVNDPSAFVHIKVDIENKVLYILEEYVKTGMLNDEIAKVIHSLGYQKERIIADSAEKKSIAEIRQRGVDRITAARKGPDSIMQGIQFIQQFKIVIDERCFKTIEEFDNYTWQKDKHTNEYINKPVDTYNHVIDAVRYSCEPIRVNPHDDSETYRAFKTFNL